MVDSILYIVEVCVESLHKLCAGVLAHLMPELRKSKVSLAELTSVQPYIFVQFYVK